MLRGSSVNDSRKPTIPALTMPGRKIGSSICQNLCQGLAPRSSPRQRHSSPPDPSFGVSDVGGIAGLLQCECLGSFSASRINDLRKSPREVNEVTQNSQTQRTPGHLRMHDQNVHATHSVNFFEFFSPDRKNMLAWEQGTGRTDVRGAETPVLERRMFRKLYRAGPAVAKPMAIGVNVILETTVVLEISLHQRLQQKMAGFAVWRSKTFRRYSKLPFHGLETAIELFNNLSGSRGIGRMVHISVMCKLMPLF